MEAKENKPNSALKDEELDVVSGGVILPGLVVPPPGRPDPIPDDPNGFAKPGRPDKDPNFF